MPTIDVDSAELERMLGLKLHGDLSKIDEVLAYAKGEVKQYDEKSGAMSVEIKDTNRPDTWNIEGLARTLKGFLGLETGLRQYPLGKAIVKVNVDRELKGIRPFIGCSVVRNISLTDAAIRGIMQLQDKLDHTYGRNRRRTSIGLYNFDLISSPLSYTVAKPETVSFVPLGFDKKMNLKEIVEQHPKGLEYGNIVSGHPLFPVLLDAEDKVLSFPPIINSNDLGKVTEETRNILVEVTGTVKETVLNTLRIVTLSLVDRGGKAHAAEVCYPDEDAETTPSFASRVMKLKVTDVNSVLGLCLSTEKIVKCLEKAGCGAKIAGPIREGQAEAELSVQVPCYRLDVMHPVDLIEDVAIAYGYNKIEPRWRKLPTTGAVRPEQEPLDTARELMVGMGFQEILSFTLTSPESLFAKMNLKRQQVVEIVNPKVQALNCLRNWLLPGLMEFLSCNLHVECPQRIFELGKATVLDEKGETKTLDEEMLAAAVSHTTAGFSEVKSCLDALLSNMGVEWRIKPRSHRSFVRGRVGAVVVAGKEVGFLGEIHPRVLEAWTLENPVAAFELHMDKIVRIRNRNT